MRLPLQIWESILPFANVKDDCCVNSSTLRHIDSDTVTLLQTEGPLLYIIEKQEVTEI